MDKSVTKNGKEYHSGKVYIYGKDKADNKTPFDAPGVYNDPKWFDNSTGNFHIVPDQKVFVNVKMDCIKLVGIARADIIDKLKEMLKEKPEIILNAKVGWGAPNENRNIEKCVQLEKNEFIFQLNFERMYVHNKRVNCMFGLFQFYKHPFEDNGVNISKPGFSMAYPASYKNSKKEPQITDTHVVYNPELPSLFQLWEENNLEAVCKAFLDFADKNC